MSGRNFAADYSSRCKIRISGPAGHHDLLLRLGTTSSSADATTAANDFVVLAQNVVDINATFQSASFAPVGSDAFTPLSGFISVPGNNGVTYTPASQAGGYYTAPIFRSALGSRYPLYFFYANPLFNEACEFATGDLPAAWADIVTLLSTDSRFTAIDRELLVSLGHADVGINDEVTAKLRR